MLLSMLWFDVLVDGCGCGFLMMMLFLLMILVLMMNVVPVDNDPVVPVVPDGDDPVD